MPIPAQCFPDAVQAAQRAYCDTMAAVWRQVVAGEVTEADYWRIGDGEPLTICRAAIDAAAAEYDAGRPSPRMSRRERGQAAAWTAGAAPAGAAALRPGDYVTVRTSSPLGWLIRVFTGSPFDHAFVCLGGGDIAEATTWGVKVDGIARYRGHLAATNAAETVSAAQRATITVTARSFTGRRYGWADLGVIVLRRAGARWGWLGRAATYRGTLICSELVALSGDAAGMGWQCGEPSAAYVTPGDLAARRVMRLVKWE